MMQGNGQNQNQNPNQTNAWGNIGGGIGDLLAAFGLYNGSKDFKNPADSAMPYMNQITNMLPGMYNPYINAGQSQIPGLQSQFNQLVNNPGGMLNNIGQSFHQSPGFQFQTDQALGAANRAAAAGGMAGTPMEQQNLATTVNGLANQDYYNYLNHATNLYGQGLQGMQGMYSTGLNATNSLSSQLSQALASQGQLAYSGQNTQNQHDQGTQGGIWGLISGALGGLGQGAGQMGGIGGLLSLLGGL